MKTRLIFRGGYTAINLASENKEYIPSAKQSDVSVTLLARNYKGLSNTGSNIVLEIFEVEDEPDN